MPAQAGGGGYDVTPDVRSSVCIFVSGADFSHIAHRGVYVSFGGYDV